MSHTALLLIDLQNDYFPSFKDAKWPLENMESAAKNAQQLLTMFRDQNRPVIHIQHEATSARIPFFQPNTAGIDIHESVAPIGTEPVVVKHKANGFLNTNLQDVLKDLAVTDLVIAGAMTQNCIDSTTRAAADLGYNCVVIEDACAAMALEQGGEIVPAAQVHRAFIAALGFAFAKIEKTQDQLV